MIAPTTPVPVEPPPLGCRLHDWTTAAREEPRVTPSARGRGILFDLDDTLYPREEYVQSGLLAVARYVEERYGLPALDGFATLTQARRSGSHGRELQAFCGRHGFPEGLVRDLLAVFRAHRPPLRLPRAAKTVLARLRADDWRMVIVTNGLPSVQREKVAALGLTSLVEHVIYAEEVTPGGKPAPEVFRTALRRLGLPARRCVAVGDDPKCDIAGARAAGLRTVRVIPPAHDIADDSGADATIAGLASLPSLLDTLLDAVTPDAA